MISKYAQLSLFQHDLDLSVKAGVWATQKHNEGILDQSYRGSQTFLIFGQYFATIDASGTLTGICLGANKSGEFYGYAK